MTPLTQDQMREAVEIARRFEHSTEPFLGPLSRALLQAVENQRRPGTVEVCPNVAHPTLDPKRGCWWPNAAECENDNCPIRAGRDGQ